MKHTIIRFTPKPPPDEVPYTWDEVPVGAKCEIVGYDAPARILGVKCRDGTFYSDSDDLPTTWLHEYRWIVCNKDGNYRGKPTDYQWVPWNDVPDGALCVPHAAPDRLARREWTCAQVIVPASFEMTQQVASTWRLARPDEIEIVEVDSCPPSTA